MVKNNLPPQSQNYIQRLERENRDLQTKVRTLTSRQNAGSDRADAQLSSLSSQVKELQEQFQQVDLFPDVYTADGTPVLTGVLVSVDKPSWASGGLVLGMNFEPASGFVTGGSEIVVEFRHGTPDRYSQEAQGFDVVYDLTTSLHGVWGDGPLPFNYEKSMQKQVYVDMTNDTQLYTWARIYGLAGDWVMFSHSMTILWVR